MTVVSSYLSDKNVLKRHKSSGSASIDAPNSATPHSSYQTTYTVDHDLGYIPQVRVYFESSASDGRVYPAGGSRASAQYPGIAGFPVFCLWNLTTTQLIIKLEASATQTGTRKIYWVIYEDEA